MININNMPSVGRMAVAATSLLAMANAHMYISEPKPIAGNEIKNPLSDTGSDFPCHGAELPTSGGQKMSAGDSFELKMEIGGGANTAVHGGGSCQLSLTYETDSEKVKDPKNWHVIYSIEGGCPANAAANLQDGFENCKTDGESECTHVWDIPMPKGVKPGHAILAWTWQNTIGNREFYMSCSAVDIEGGSGDEMGEFPALFVANMANVEGGSCPTEENSDVLYPNPGKYGTTMSATDGGKNWPKATPTGSGCDQGGSAAEPTGEPSGYGSGSASGSSSSEAAPSYGAPAQTSAPSYSASAAPSASDYNVPDHVQSGIQSYGNQKGRETSTQAAQAQTTFATSASRAAAPSSAAAASSAAPAPTGYSSGSESNTTASSDSTECSEEGALICIGDDAFGICDHGAAVSRPLASGTVCKDGVISGRNRFRRHIHGAHKH